MYEYTWCPPCQTGPYNHSKLLARRLIIIIWGKIRPRLHDPNRSDKNERWPQRRECPPPRRQDKTPRRALAADWQGLSSAA